MTHRGVAFLTVVAFTFFCSQHSIADTLPEHVIFRTEQRLSTGLGGLSAMDGRCQSKALAADLDGTWLAVLSASGAGNSARERLEAAGADGPFFNMISQELASDLVDLFDGNISATIFLDEFGKPAINPGKVWTATLADGSYAGSSYGDWTSFSGGARVGYPAGTNSSWVDWFQETGVDSASLYCVRSNRLPLFASPPPPEFIHTVFVSSATYDGNFGGLAGADAECQTLAGAAGMGDRTWRAVLSDSTRNANDRIAVRGPVLDTSGQLIADDGDDFFDGGQMTFVRFDENGNLRNGQLVWTGSHPDGSQYSAAGPGAYKGDWTSATGLTMVGGTLEMGAGWLTKQLNQQPARLYCIDGQSDLDLPTQENPNDNGADVYLSTGEYTRTETDLEVPGRGMDFAWRRTYRSRFGPDSGQGIGWNYNYNIFIEQFANGLVLNDGTGRRDLLEALPDGTFATDGFFRTGRFLPNGEFELQYAENTVWTFFAPHPESDVSIGRIREIRDANGNSFTFSYDAAGQLRSIIDALNREIRVTWSGGRIQQVEDFAGRTVTYIYSSGRLNSVTGPPIVGTPNGNDFPAGRTTSYTYSSGFADERLNHNLLTVVDPLGETVLRNEYAGTTDEDDIEFDRLVAQYPGDGAAVIHYAYELIDPLPGTENATKLAVTNDRMGNVSELYFDDGNRLVVSREYTGRAVADQPTTSTDNRPSGKLRATDPDFFEERWIYNQDSLWTRQVLANGSHIERTYQSEIDPDSGARTRGNLLEERRVAGSFAGQCEQIAAELGFSDSQAPQLPVERTIAGDTTLFARDEFGNLESITTPIPSVVEEFEYDAQGNVVSHVYPDLGATARRVDDMTYYPGFAGSDPCFGDCPSGAGLLASLTIGAQAGGPEHTRQLEYDAFGNPKRMVDFRGNDILLDYNAVNEPVRTQSRATSAGRHVVQTFYDAAGSVVRSETSNFDEYGNPGNPAIYSVDFVYDVLGNRTHRIEQIDATTSAETRFEYDANDNLVLIRSPEAVAGNQPANVVERVYDERDLLLRETRAPGTPQASTTEYDYNSLGQLEAVRTGIELGVLHERRLEYDCHGRLVAETDEMGNRTEYTLDEYGNRTRIVTHGELNDGPGSTNNVRLAERLQTFDDLQRLIQADDLIFDPATQSPIGDGVSRRQWAYDGSSSLLRMIDDLGREELYSYDALRRLASVTDPRGNVEQYEYDANGNRAQLTETLLSDTGLDRTVVTTTEYDERDRLFRLTDNLSQTQTMQYDSRGNVALEVDKLGNVVRHAYDGMSRRVETVRELRQGGVGSGSLEDTIRTTISWDLNSRVVERTDDNDNTVGTTYDALNRRIRVIYADGTTESFNHSAAGNEISMIDANGTAVTKAYDLAHRLAAVNVTPGAGVATDTTFENYAYDGLSRIIAAGNDRSLVTRSYDSLDRLTEESIDGLPPTTFAYDGVGNPTSLSYPGGRVVGVTYNANDRVSSLQSGGQVLASFAYLGPRLVEQRTYPNGGLPVTTTYLYDEILRLEQSTHASVSEVVDAHAYSWDAQSNLATRQDIRPGGPGTDQTYTYDSAYRLWESLTQGVSTELVDYDIDGVHNWADVFGGSCPGPYSQISDDALMNRYTNTGCDSRVYDANGNLVSILGAGSGTILDYDFKNRLVGFTPPGSVDRASYSYDVFGRRVVKEVPSGADSEVTRYAYDHRGHVVEERDAMGLTLATYVYAGTSSLPVSMSRIGTDHFYLEDYLASAVAVADAQGNVVERYSYSDFGEPTFLDTAGQPLTASAVQNPYLFAGQRYDEESGLYQMGRRFMESKIGRFTSSDPLGTWADPLAFGNSYTYAANNPQTWIDPTGTAAVRNTSSGTINQSYSFTGLSSLDQSFTVIDNGTIDPSTEPTGRVKRIAGEVPAANPQSYVLLRPTAATRAHTPCTPETHPWCHCEGDGCPAPPPEGDGHGRGQEEKCRLCDFFDWLRDILLEIGDVG